MKKIIAARVVTALTLLTTFGLFVGGGTASAGPGRPEVSAEQYEIMFGQCRYAETAALRAECRTMVEQTYMIGRTNPGLDCRTYSGVTVCGELVLSARQRQCVRQAVDAGLGPRRAEVECYAFQRPVSLPGG
jgi:hypothetical protein